jgi:molecular chaperone DnaK (HSP70)
MAERSEPIVGIDLGTTYSVVAAFDPSGRPMTMGQAETASGFAISKKKWTSCGRFHALVRLLDRVRVPSRPSSIESSSSRTV